jgi:hypothetical protein
MSSMRFVPGEKVTFVSGARLVVGLKNGKTEGNSGIGLTKHQRKVGNPLVNGRQLPAAQKLRRRATGVPDS